MFILSNDEVHKIYKEIFEGDYVPHIEDKPKFPDKDILYIAIESAEILSSDDNGIKMLKIVKEGI